MLLILELRRTLQIALVLYANDIDEGLELESTLSFVGESRGMSWVIIDQDVMFAGGEQCCPLQGQITESSRRERRDTSSLSYSGVTAKNVRQYDAAGDSVTPVDP